MYKSAMTDFIMRVSSFDSATRFKLLKDRTDYCHLYQVVVKVLPP